MKLTRYLILMLLIIALTTTAFSAGNVLSRNISVYATVTIPDDASIWEKLQEIENQTNTSALPMITIGGLDTLYSGGDNITVFTSITLQGEPVDAANYCNITVTHLNGSEVVYDLISVNMTKISTGWYYLNWTIPGGAIHTSYGVLIEADPSGYRTQATSGFKVGFTLNVSITVDVSTISEMLDCDGTDDSPICNYTDNLQSSADTIRDMLNCSGGDTNSDICGYTDGVEGGINTLSSELSTHNAVVWGKLVTISDAIDIIDSNTDDLEEALDCDNSTDDVCKKIEDMRTVVNEINSTTKDILVNMTGTSSTSLNVTSITELLNIIEDELNCSSINPSDICYRLGIIENNTGSIMNTTQNILNASQTIMGIVNYINDVRWGNFSYTEPIPTVLTLRGRVKDMEGSILEQGSMEINISDTTIPEIVWSHTFDDVLEEGIFNMVLGGTYELSLIPMRKYKRDVTICDGIIFDPESDRCDTFTTYFIA